jgi:hypothetical protein
MNQSEGTSAIERLAAWGDERLPEDLVQELLVMGSAAVPALVAVLEESQGRWPPVQAAALLGKIGDPAAIEPSLEALRVCERTTVLSDHLVFALEAFGQAAVAPALAAHDGSDDPEFRADVLCALSSSGARDERLFALLMEALEAEHRSGEWGIAAANLAEYGDPRALGRLVGVFDALPHELETPDDDQVVFELEDAIETLGGTLTPAQAERAEKARRARRAFFEKPRHRRALDFVASQAVLPPSRVPVRKAARPGRNDPCWCASGKKYKKCHLVADEAPSASPPA